LLAWAKARDFREQANEYLNRARLEPEGDVQRRFVDVAQHYRILAEAEASNAGRLGNERRGQSETSQSGSPNGSIEVQALHLKLQLFASQQTDQTVRSQCHAVDKKLAEVVEENHPPLRQVLARHVEQLEKAIRRSTTDS
jgi:gas vesicle protein